MNRIWAPWRIKYITSEKEKVCIFCKAYKEKKDKKNLVILRSDYSFVLFNKFPYNNGHLLIAPYRHIANLEELKDLEISDIHSILTKMLSVLKKTIKPDGFNIGINLGKVSGAGIEEHLHIHLVPRWNGDTNFMPVISNTKVISQSLEDLYKKIKKYL